MAFGEDLRLSCADDRWPAYDSARRCAMPRGPDMTSMIAVRAGYAKSGEYSLEPGARLTRFLSVPILRRQRTLLIRSGFMVAAIVGLDPLDSLLLRRAIDQHMGERASSSLIA
jgi:hypothetical protein